MASEGKVRNVERDVKLRVMIPAGGGCELMDAAVAGAGGGRVVTAEDEEL